MTGTESLVDDRSTPPPVEDKGCPLCGAPPGDFCHTPSGKPRDDHKAREYASAEPESVDE